MNVSFCVTCYDGDVHLLHDRLISIYDEQTVTPDEVLVITSGVSSGPIVWDSSRPNLTIKTFEKRLFPGGARNQGGRLAKGDVVCFCDVDDPIHPQKCEVIKRVFDDGLNHVDALLHNYKLNTHDFTPIEVDQIEVEKITKVDPRWEEEQNYIFNPHKDIPRTNVEAASKRDICHGHISVRKEVFSELAFREDMWLGEDGDFCQSIVKSNKFDLYYTPLVLINYIT